MIWKKRALILLTTFLLFIFSGIITCILYLKGFDVLAERFLLITEILLGIDIVVTLFLQFTSERTRKKTKKKVSGDFTDGTSK